MAACFTNCRCRPDGQSKIGTAILTSDGGGNRFPFSVHPREPLCVFHIWRSNMEYRETFTVANISTLRKTNRRRHGCGGGGGDSGFVERGDVWKAGGRNRIGF